MSINHRTTGVAQRFDTQLTTWSEGIHNDLVLYLRAKASRHINTLPDKFLTQLFAGRVELKDILLDENREQINLIVTNVNSRIALAASYNFITKELPTLIANNFGVGVPANAKFEVQNPVWNFYNLTDKLSRRHSTSSLLVLLQHQCEKLCEVTKVPCYINTNPKHISALYADLQTKLTQRVRPYVVNIPDDVSDWRKQLANNLKLYLQIKYINETAFTLGKFFAKSNTIGENIEFAKKLFSPETSITTLAADKAYNTLMPDSEKTKNAFEKTLDLTQSFIPKPALQLNKDLKEILATLGGAETIPTLLPILRYAESLLIYDIAEGKLDAAFRHNQKCVFNMVERVEYYIRRHPELNSTPPSPTSPLLPS